MNDYYRFGVIVIGGGHAGTEAALASARIGVKTLLISHSIDTLGQMSCNPAIGGIGKGHLVKEIDALGGIMAKAADHAGIQWRTLNASKGAAVQATRAQADRQLYRSYIRQTLQNQPNLLLFQESVDDVLLQGERIIGVRTQSGLTFEAQAVVLTAGTFLAGKIHIGMQHYAAGRAGDAPAITLAQRLRDIFPHTLRLKTGTPPRIDRRTVNFSTMQEQYGDTPVPVFSYLGQPSEHPQQMCCYITHTNAKTHDIIRANMSQSPLYNGRIEGTGPRYCPSIEDKVVRFADKQQHQIFVEPEGLTTQELYPNGISTSLPFVVQQQIIHSIKGFEQAHIVRPGYAIEYDYFDPTQLQTSLQTKAIKGLYFAGQINGTTGYEEAAAQGLIAGCNAACQYLQRPPLTLQRSQAYIGVMLDDLLTQGTQEPYRMFTSRAEYRLSLREDNADIRLTPLGYEYHLVDAQRWQFFQYKNEQVNAYLNAAQNTKVKRLQLAKLHKTEENLTLAALFKRPQWQQQHLQPLMSQLQSQLQQPDSATALPHLLPQQAQQLQQQITQQVYVQLKYAGYLQRQEVEIKRLKTKENQRIPAPFDYSQLPGLSAEVMLKLQHQQPETIGQASRIAGVTPAAISILLVALKRQAQHKLKKSKLT